MLLPVKIIICIQYKKNKKKYSKKNSHTGNGKKTTKREQQYW